MLKPPSSGIRWTEFRIDTPTFKITSVEKPDMSPFLFHMTGGEALTSILTGAGMTLPENTGFLRSCIPESSGNYNAKVVCFTESPTFALDFFRYRSFARWSNDQRFGIGFDKSELVRCNVRPCVYADSQLTSDINKIKKHFDLLPMADQQLSSLFKSFIDRIYPLTTPLLEEELFQGYMWEREWRHTDPKGLIFPYRAIKIICCPESEEQAIRKILGRYSTDIKFVRSWKEYNEVTSFLKNRSESLHVPPDAGYPDEEEFLSILKEQLVNHIALLNKIKAYETFVDSIADKKEAISSGISDLESGIENLERQIERLNNRRR